MVKIWNQIILSFREHLFARNYEELCLRIQRQTHKQHNKNKLLV